MQGSAGGLGLLARRGSESRGLAGDGAQAGKDSRGKGLLDRPRLRGQRAVETQGGQGKGPL